MLSEEDLKNDGGRDFIIWIICWLFLFAILVYIVGKYGGG